MSAKILTDALQRRLVHGLIDLHPLPWRIGKNEPASYLCEVVDAKKKLVLMCMSEPEAVELIDAAMILASDASNADLEMDRHARQENIVMTKPKTVAELFDTMMPAALTRDPAKARELNATYGFKILGSGTDAGEWMIDCTAAQPTCKRAAGPAQCRIQISSSDLMTIVNDPNIAIQLYFQGKLAVEGDPMLAMKLQALFSLIPGITSPRTP
jgi:hypothetical protein